MATLADELLNDFEDSGDENEEQHDETPQDDGVASLFPADTPAQQPKAGGEEGGMDLDGDEEEAEDDEELMEGAAAKQARDAPEEEEEVKARVEKMQLGNVSDVRSVAGLMKTLQPVLDKIAHYKGLPPDKQTKNIGSVEDNPEYKLLTQSNTLATQIDSEIILVHKFIRDHYSLRFPELETLVTNPLDYAKTVAIIGNGPMDAESIKKKSSSSDNPVGQPLNKVLDGPSMMVVTVETTTSQGRDLTETELNTVLKACEMTLQLDNAKKVLTEYVQSRMNIFAPNLTALIGSLTAAQLINYAGGIKGLAKTPSCNIAVLGAKRASGTGFATNTSVRNQGFLYHSEIIRNIPNDLKKQAMRIVSAKIVLAARVDSIHSSPDGSTGESLKQQCLDRLDKLTEPPPNKGIRALPVPDDKPSRKRGGRRVRKAKEAYAMTELRKAQNRMAFGKEEAEAGYGTGDGTKGLGMIGQGNDGRIRATQIDQRTKAKLSKKNPGWGGATPVSGMASTMRGSGTAGNASVLKGHGLRSSGVGTAGTASTIAFTPVQGLELVDPKVREEVNRKRKADEDRWFGGGTFTQIGGAKTETGGKKDADGFKVPSLPMKKPKQ
ncbi:U4/U6-U5 snRNP complex subunit prp31 [Diplodia seriata]|uniref:Putative pre-mrna splicing factor n=1 Tax=Diplodia seriata TaxID=420778 RepID=A0A0G2GEE7_9PEZI|nr:putative pre-mrna splicing factor [Diplodia seriata]OMP88479.1 U4/U6 small nuclear ribonucleoprotein Prp31 [Diplodia seriata]